ncbi:MAG: alpha/beta fold hydrolase [Anaerolineae bacterium]
MAQKTNWKLAAVKFGVRLLETIAPTLAGQVVFKMFLTPHPRPTSEIEQRILNQAQRVIVYHGKDRLSGYVWENTGATVLLVHGWESSAGSLTPLVSPLQAQGYRVVAFDAPAHGISRAKQTNLVDFARAIREAIDQFGPVYAIIAHSFGGAGTVVAATDGLPVERVVLLAPPARLINLVNTYAQMLSLSPRMIEEIHRNTMKIIGKPVEYFSAEYLADKLTQPGLLVHDRRDPVVPFADSEAIAAYWKAARLFATDGLGHRNIRQNPVVVQEIMGFLAEEKLSLRLAGD